MKSIKGYIFLCLIGLSLIAKVSYALPFEIIPNGELPTSIVSGEQVPASYIVTNNTGSKRAGNFVKYLPPHVTQVTTGVGACGETFTLTAHNTPNDHCTLNLLVSGPVNANDPNPHHHLFVCFPGGATCAGTNSPLNVELINPILYGVTGEDGTTQHTLFNVDPNSGNATQIMPLSQNTCCGHVISSDGMSLYHWNGHNNPNQIFEKIDLQTLTTTAIPLTGFAIGEPNGAVFFNGAFLYADYEEQFSSLTVNGFATQLGNTDGRIRGMACWEHRVYGVNPFDNELFEVNPANGTKLSTTTITLAGLTVQGAVGLTVNPGSGTFYALLKVAGSEPRKLVTIDVNTGVATLIGDADDGTGLKFSSIAFNPTNPNC
jgi:hypothetical protein